METIHPGSGNLRKNITQAQLDAFNLRGLLPEAWDWRNLNREPYITPPGRHVYRLVNELPIQTL